MRMQKRQNSSLYLRIFQRERAQNQKKERTYFLDVIIFKIRMILCVIQRVIL
jgi:hypothetical protein